MLIVGDDRIRDMLASGIEDIPSQLDESFTVDDIDKQFKGMRHKTAAGDDGLPAGFLIHAPIVCQTWPLILAFKYACGWEKTPVAGPPVA